MQRVVRPAASHRPAKPYEAPKLQLKLISIFLFMSQAGIASTEYPGLPPDCWSESRSVHSGIPDSWKLLEKNLKFSHIREEPKGKKFIRTIKDTILWLTDFAPNLT